MSGKSKRSSTATPQPRLGTSTPLNPSGPSSGSNTAGAAATGATTTTGAAAAAATAATNTRPPSPLSPTRHSRLLEKAELQNLNDRLAVYIDRVRNLETENARLSIEVQSTRDTVSRETTNIKSLYEGELIDARRLLDETAREKAKLEIDTKRMWEEIEDLKARLDKKTKECSIADGNARMYETRFNDLNTKYTATNAERKKIIDESNELQKELDRLKQQFNEVRKNLEDETLARVDLENSIQSLREELTFKDQIHSQEMNETRSRRVVEISEIDGRLCEQYEAKLQQSLQELRDQYEAQMRINRDEIEMLYESKIKNLQAAANRTNSATSGAFEELRTTRTRIDTLNGRINELEKTNAALNARIRDLEQLLDNEQARRAADVGSLEAELQRLRDEMTHQLQEYQDLMDIKVSLDLEIAAYDKLLCGEESRLNITPNVSNVATVSSLSQSYRSVRGTPARKTPSRGFSLGGAASKRKRTVIDESEDSSQSEFFVTGSAKGDIKISEVDPDGKFVRVQNKGPKEIAIGGWQLQRSVDGRETLFKFHRTVKVEAGGQVTVWSSDAGITHEPPANIVMNTQKWFVADNMKTVLINSDGEEVAASERVKRQISRHRFGRSVVDGETKRPNGEEKCCLM